ncbi:MAG: metal ABC transporter solute-binding protein, Zn/Mn family [Candidatus Levyibacteriota bacterium]
MNKVITGIIGAVVVLVAIIFIGKGMHNNAGIAMQGSSTINVVAAENFYGDIIKQLGGNHVQVLSILSDPNADPHQYESNVQDGIAVAKANLVIENGEGYDTWMDKLLSASPNKNRVVLVGTQIADHKITDNPHVWYSFENTRTIAGKITDTLKQQDPTHASEYDQNLTTFDNSLQPLQQKISDIKAKYSGAPVALTETIYLYQTQPEGLNVLTPYEFEKAIAEGNDPSADDVAKANDQITKKQVKVLIYNEQTITPVTTNLQNEAKQLNIPIVPVTETLPQGKHYQDWMMGQLTGLESALQSTK